MTKIKVMVTLEADATEEIIGAMEEYGEDAVLALLTESVVDTMVDGGDFFEFTVSGYAVAEKQNEEDGEDGE